MPSPLADLPHASAAIARGADDAPRLVVHVPPELGAADYFPSAAEAARVVSITARGQTVEVTYLPGPPIEARGLVVTLTGAYRVEAREESP
jgi:hypothetical protein